MNIYLIIDESGSMGPLRADTIGGFNRFLADQKALSAGDAKADEAFLHVLCFSTIINRKPIWGTNVNDVPEWEERDYNPGGGTPLLDAVGETVTDADGEDGLIVIITDGEENSSTKFTKAQIAALLTEKQDEGWKVVYLGANVDAFTEGGGLGVRSQTISSYNPTSAGTQTLYAAASMMATSSRTGVGYTVTSDSAGNPVVNTETTTKPKARKTKVTTK